MSEDKLKNIISEFNPEKFRDFFREKNSKFSPKKEDFSGYNDENYNDCIKIGEIDFPDSTNMVVCAMKTDNSLSERSGKKTQYEKGKKILKDTQSDAGIFIFYDKDGNFRFSLIYANYLGKKRDWSTFKRFTYFVCKKFTNKTFILRIGRGDFTTFENLKEAFSVEKVTKEFYNDIAYWYFWAIKKVKFPKDAEEEDNGRSMSVIRMITRIIFIWFMKERGLIKNDLFSNERISELLKNTSSKESTYYKAILQNLFFATLNTQIKDRKFRFNIKGWKNSSYMDHSVYRYEDMFNDKEDMLDLFKDIPFLNGGLFDCLDKTESENGKNVEFRYDGFSDKEKDLKVPNLLFFAEEMNVDLNSDYGTKDKNYTVKGLINTLSSYNFVMDENDPNDAEIALDPELLGKVFENLLASFNPETSSTARKATGSYYTPREIVDYMVTQSLKEYYKTGLENKKDIEKDLDDLFTSDNHENPFNKETSKKIVELTDKLRIVDPAVGSGAFPMGILNKLVFILSKLDPGNTYWKEQQIKAVEENISDPVIRKSLKSNIEEQFADKNPDYGRKLYLIEKCIYGVDIQQIAVEIAKLRFFISLLVDENIDKTKENWGIKPLPNLDYKIMQGNSLLEEYNGIKLIDEKMLKKTSENKEDLMGSLKKRQNALQSEYILLHSKKKLTNIKKIQLNDELNKIKDQIKKLSKTEKNSKDDDLFDAAKESKGLFQKINMLREEFFIESDRVKKDKLKEEIEEIEWKFIEASLKEQGKESEIPKLKKVIRSNSKPYFLWHFNFGEVFIEKGGFDIVIGNPPYVKEYTFRNAFDGLRSSEYYQGKMDIWYFFACKCIDLLKKETGILTFIATNNWVTNSGASKMRNKVISDTKIMIMLDFGNYKIFESADIQTMVLILKKDKNNSKYDFELRRSLGDKIIYEDIINLIQNKLSVKCEFLKPIFLRDNFDNKSLTFSNNEYENILNKILKKRNFILDEKREIAQGIVPNPDVINSKNILNIPQNRINKSDIKIGDGVFIIPLDYLKGLSDIERKYLKPIYEPYLVDKYTIDFYDKEILYLNKKNIKDINKLPKIKEHLLKFHEIMDNRRENLKGLLDYYHLHWSRDKYFFEKGPKILSVRKCINPIFAYTEKEAYVMMSFNVIRSSRINLKFLTALLNSRLIAFWLKEKGKMQGNNYQVDKEPLIQIPIYISKNIYLFDKMLDKIIDLKSKDKNTIELENQIDVMVYKLYELTYDEVKIVDPEFWMSEGEYEKFYF